MLTYKKYNFKYSSFYLAEKLKKRWIISQVFITIVSFGICCISLGNTCKLKKYQNSKFFEMLHIDKGAGS